MVHEEYLQTLAITSPPFLHIITATISTIRSRTGGGGRNRRGVKEGRGVGRVVVVMGVVVVMSLRRCGIGMVVIIIVVLVARGGSGGLVVVIVIGGGRGDGGHDGRQPFAIPTANEVTQIRTSTSAIPSHWFAVLLVGGKALAVRRLLAIRQ